MITKNELDVRNQALEEAAKICDAMDRTSPRKQYRDASAWLASRIRALASTPSAAMQGQGVPVGWKLVPCESDEMMHIRGCEATSGFVDWEVDGPNNGEDCSAMVERIYDAMLAAAPTPPAAQPQAGGQELTDAEAHEILLKMRDHMEKWAEKNDQDGYNEDEWPTFSGECIRFLQSHITGTKGATE